MAESNHHRDFAEHDPEKGRVEADDPLASLARLIGRSVPMNRSAQDRRSSIGKRYAAPDQAEPSGETYWARNENQRDPEFEHRYAIGNEELYDSSARANPPPPFRASDLDREQVDTGTASQTAHELSAFGEGHGDTAACRGAAEESSALLDSHYDEHDRETLTARGRPHIVAHARMRDRVKFGSRTAGLNSRQVARSRAEDRSTV